MTILASLTKIGSPSNSMSNSTSKQSVENNVGVANKVGDDSSAHYRWNHYGWRPWGWSPYPYYRRGWWY